jgi:hypothetical protein
MISDGVINGRDKMGFTGLDPYYTVGDFYGTTNTAKIPAAAHSLGSINLTPGGQNPKPEHGANPNCTANNASGSNAGDAGASLWDGDANGAALVAGCANWIPPTGFTGPSFPPTSKFTSTDYARIIAKDNLTEQDYMNLKDAAQTSGIYCVSNGGGFNCTDRGSAFTITGGSVQSLLIRTPALPNNVVVYFDFPSAGCDSTCSNHSLQWQESWAGCDANNPANTKTLTLVIRYGSVSFQAGTNVNGAVLAPEGQVEDRGGASVQGTVLAKSIIMRGSSGFSLSTCWVQNMPGPFLGVTPDTWIELDR